MRPCVTALILAAGAGSRMKLNMTKQKIKLGEESVLRRTVRIFNECDLVSSIIVVARLDELDFAKEAVLGLEKVREIVVGGKTRAESAKCGFLAIDTECDFVAIHDAARCFVTTQMICDVVNDAIKYGAATASTRVTDTVKRVDLESNITSTVNRDELVLIQTPQICKKDWYESALEAADSLGADLTDDNMLLENIGVYPHCTDTGKNNIKITTPEDLLYANFLLNEERRDD